jgi:hypothetical protein
MEKLKLTKRQKVHSDMTFDDDKLKRIGIAENFNLLFEETTQPFVIALDSPWGTGKTQFIHMWRNLLGEKESLYMNLWEEDFLLNPFFSLTESLIPLFEKYKVDNLDSVKNDLAKVAKEFSRAAVDKVFNVKIENLWEKNITQERKKDKNKFKEHLVKLSLKIREETKFPLILFIDELDRCRPSYAVGFLEVIKHFFDIENIIFVLGIDAEQLQYSVSSLYGEGMKAKEYLRKFIDISYSFPEPILDDYLDFLFPEFNCGEKHPDIIKATKGIIKKFNPSLREVDHLFTRLNLIEKDINDSYIQASFYLSLKIFEEEEYNKIKNKQCSLGSTLGFIRYFKYIGSNIQVIALWKIANDLILENSNSEIEYINNLKKLFSTLVGKWGWIKDFLLKSKFSMDSHFSAHPMVDIFIEDEGISQQKNITIVKTLFNGKDSVTSQFQELIKKVEFLEGLSFGKDEEKNP